MKIIPNFMRKLMVSPKAYKWLNEMESPYVSDDCDKWVPYEWRHVEGTLAPCKNGLHFCTNAQGIIKWIPFGHNLSLWEAEYDRNDFVISYDNKVASRSGRITKQLLSQEDIREFLIDFIKDYKGQMEVFHPALGFYKSSDFDTSRIVRLINSKSIINSNYLPFSSDDWPNGAERGIVMEIKMGYYNFAFDMIVDKKLLAKKLMEFIEKNNDESLKTVVDTNTKV